MGGKPPIFKGDSDPWKTISSWFDALVFLAGVYAYHIDILSSALLSRRIRHIACIRVA